MRWVYEPVAKHVQGDGDSNAETSRDLPVTTSLNKCLESIVPEATILAIIDCPRKFVHGGFFLATHVVYRNTSCALGRQ
jgi:hypothetical protein